MEVRMRYHNITKEDMLNGDGLRVVLWTAGCSHGCKGCHNQVTWDCNGGLPYDEAAKQEIFKELEKDYIAGITFSGGDPLHINNREQIKELAEEIKEKYPSKTTWLYTGYSWEEIKDWDIIKSLDVVIDGKFELDKRNVQLHWKGSSNQRVIDVKKTLKSGQVVVHF
jgi:anaerobic ribonucleoside-triphosphate reductase activating protein